MKLSRTTVFGLIVTLVLYGCADAAREAATQQDQQLATQNKPVVVNFSLAPDEQGRLCAEGKVTATMSIDSSKPLEVPVDCKVNLLSGNLGDVSVGMHTFTIEYSRDGVLISRTSAIAEITASTTTTLAFEPPRYIDSDGDGFTNLAELVTFGLYSLAWNNPNIRPPAETPRFSTNYVMADQVGKAFLAGPSGSANYQLQPGI